MINKRLYRISIAGGIGAIATMVVLFFGASQAFPFFVGNVGDFMVKGDSMEVSDFKLTLGIDQTSGSNGSQMPAGEMNLGKAVIQNMVLEKAFDAGSAIGNIPQRTWKFRLTVATPVTLEGAVLNSSGLCADTLVASNLEVDGAGAHTGTFVDDFSMTASQLSLQGAGIQATYLAVSSITLNSIKLTVEPGGYDKAACLP